MTNYPRAQDPELVGSYPAVVHAGGGYVWDAVLEYRVWCHPAEGAPDVAEGDDYYYVFDTYEAALQYADGNIGAEPPLALVLQEEYIDEPTEGHYIHVKERRLTEWPVEFLNRPQRTADTIPDFLSPSAPSNRIEILRGLT